MVISVAAHESRDVIKWKRTTVIVPAGRKFTIHKIHTIEQSKAFHVAKLKLTFARRLIEAGRFDNCAA
jgi:hypothetical protein